MFQVQAGEARHAPPMILISIGALARQAVEAVAAAVVEVGGDVVTFGLIESSPMAGETTTRVGTWRAKPDGTCCEAQSYPLASAGALPGAAHRLYANLRRAGAAANGRAAGGARCVALVQLAGAGEAGQSIDGRAAVDRLVDLLKSVRAVVPVLDVSAIALTGAVAENYDPTAAWTGPFKYLCSQLQTQRTEGGAAALVQRLYLLDGRNASGEVLIEGSEMSLQAGRMLLHRWIGRHREHFDANEIVRSLKQPMAHCIGSFHARVLVAHEPALLEALAEYLVDFNLSLLEAERATDADMARVRDAAATMFAEGSKKTRDPAEIVREALEKVCAHRPVASFGAFCGVIRDAMERDHVLHRLLARARHRYALGRGFRDDASAAAAASVSQPHGDYGFGLPIEVDIATASNTPPRHSSATAASQRAPRGQSPFASGRRGSTRSVIIAILLLLTVAAAARPFFSGVTAPWIWAGTVACGLACLMALLWPRREPPPREPSPSRPAVPPGTRTPVEMFGSEPTASEVIKMAERLETLGSLGQTPGTAAGDAEHRRESVLDAIAGDWRRALAKPFIAWLADRKPAYRGATEADVLAAAARNPEEWVGCLMSAIGAGRGGSGRVSVPSGSKHTRHLVRHLLGCWREETAGAKGGASHLLHAIEPDPSSLQSYIQTAMAPFWPLLGTSATQAVLIEAGTDVWPALEKVLPSLPPEFRLVRCELRDPGSLLIVRAVQGAVGMEADWGGAPAGA